MKVIPGNNQSKGRGLMLGRIRFDVSAWERKWSYRKHIFTELG
jgi:hypothetical protein